MRKLIKPLLPLLFAGLMAGIYVVQVETWQLQRQERKLLHEIEKEQRAITELRAEWAFLTRPARIEKLARKFLKMHPPEPEQFVIPEKAKKTTE